MYIYIKGQLDARHVNKATNEPALIVINYKMLHLFEDWKCMQCSPEIQRHPLIVFETSQHKV